MSRYLSRLMSQTGVKFPGATNATPAISPQPLSVAVAPPPPLSSTADLTEQENQSESLASSPSPTSVHGTPSHSLTNGVQTGPEPPPKDRIAPEAGVNAAPAARDSQEAERFLPPETRSRATAVGNTPSPVVGPSASPPPAGNVAAPAPKSSAIIQKVIEWMTEGSQAPERPTPTEGRAPGNAIQPATMPVQVVAAVTPEKADFDGESAPQISSPSSRLSIPESAVRRSSTGSPAPAAGSQDNAWSVHIGTIQLTVEVPPEKPDPRPAPPRPVASAPAPATRTGGSRLSRYYLRPF